MVAIALLCCPVSLLAAPAAAGAAGDTPSIGAKTSGMHADLNSPLEAPPGMPSGDDP